jgi:hypothetical protein
MAHVDIIVRHAFVLYRKSNPRKYTFRDPNPREKVHLGTDSFDQTAIKLKY